MARFAQRKIKVSDRLRPSHLCKDDVGKLLLAESLLNMGEYAQKLAYYATRSYVKKYNPHFGGGLIAESIPMLEDVVAFWRGLARRLS
jgi:hypothetical protein